MRLNHYICFFIRKSARYVLVNNSLKLCFPCIYCAFSLLLSSFFSNILKDRNMWKIKENFCCWNCFRCCLNVLKDPWMSESKEEVNQQRKNLKNVIFCFLKQGRICLHFFLFLLNVHADWLPKVLIHKIFLYNLKLQICSAYANSHFCTLKKNHIRLLGAYYLKIMSIMSACQSAP